MPEFVSSPWFMVSILFTVLTTAVCFLGWKVYVYRNTHKANIAVTFDRHKELVDDIALLTTEELMKELQSRHNIPYIMLRPMSNENQRGVSIEIHEIPPAETLGTLCISASIMQHELASRGLLPPSGFNMNNFMTGMGDSDDS